MRKIYPSLFNKFTVFVLYGLLSIAAITLAQDESIPKSCGNPIDFSNHVTMGYIRLSKNPPDFNAIQWELYDFINVVASPKEGTLWNSIFSSENAEALASIDGLIDAKNKSNPDTRILLSIRNYDPVTWPVPKGGDDVDDVINYQLQFDDIIADTIKTLEKVDGVDIEYPGMRGLYCGGGEGIWEEGEGGKGKKDEDFIKFLNDLKEQMGEKILMVTVGRDAFDLEDKQIDFLNIETHHFSLYQNIREPLGPNIKSYSNSPISEFEHAYKAWTAKEAKGIQSKKIIMGIDFGNTFQVVDNQDIAKSPIVEFFPIDDENFRDDPVLENLVEISSENSLCSIPNPIDSKLHLYSFPWKDLSKSVLQGCDAIPNWIRKFDEKDSMTPWLYRSVAKTPDPNGPKIYQFISYEDSTSLSKKLNNYMSKIRGISISDVSYDDGSLLNFISGKAKSPNPGSPTPGTGTSTGGSGNNSSSPTTDPTAVAGGSNNSNLVNKGAIVGGVFGGLFGLIILGACAFIGYRYRKKPKSESFRSLLMNIPNSIKNHTTTSRNTEMTSDPTPNMFAPPTTVIPVASGYVTAMFDFTGKEENDLSFKKGDKIEVLERGDGPNDWWVGRVNGAVGEFPGNYVKET